MKSCRDAACRHAAPGLLGLDVTEAVIKHVAQLTDLHTLNLCRTGITDAGLRHLRQLTKLERLDVKQTDVSELGVQQLEKDLPQCRIRR